MMQTKTTLLGYLALFKALAALAVMLYYYPTLADPFMVTRFESAPKNYFWVMRVALINSITILLLLQITFAMQRVYPNEKLWGMRILFITAMIKSALQTQESIAPQSAHFYILLFFVILGIIAATIACRKKLTKTTLSLLRFTPKSQRISFVLLLAIALLNVPLLFL